MPRYALVNREFPFQELDYFVEQEDFVEVHGNRFWKPFVEKPIDGEGITFFLIANIMFLSLFISLLSQVKCLMIVSFEYGTWCYKKLQMILHTCSQ